MAQAAKKLAPEAPDATKSPAVRLRDVTVRFTTERGAVTALDRVSMTVARGGFLTLLGPSGCGKSTLLRVVVGSHPGDFRRGRGDGRVGGVSAGARATSASCSRTLRCSPGAPRSKTSNCRSKSARGAKRGGARNPRELLDAGRPLRPGEGLSARIVRRHAPARGDRSRACQRSEAVC